VRNRLVVADASSALVLELSSRPLVTDLATNSESLLSRLTLAPEVTTSEASMDSVLLSLPPPSSPVLAVTVALVVRNKFVVVDASNALIGRASSRQRVTVL